MSWVTIIQLLLQLAAFLARRAERADIERAAYDALELSHKERVDRAADARDDVLSGRVPVDPDDPYRRD